uniref:Uncharacterized protein n=1 Tax=Cacopsylla melanoneura TaxID=428564 RepID=A0A8D8XBU9_9HEMI
MCGIMFQRKQKIQLLPKVERLYDKVPIQNLRLASSVVRFVLASVVRFVGKTVKSTLTLRHSSMVSCLRDNGPMVQKTKDHGEEDWNGTDPAHWLCLIQVIP